MHSRQTRNRKLRPSTFKYLLPLLVVITDVSTNVSFASACVSDSYVVGVGTSANLNTVYSGNATLGGYVYVNTRANATPSSAGTKKLWLYLPNTKAGTVSAKHPDSVSKSIWAAMLLAYTYGSKINLTDSNDKCSYETGTYFDGITIVE